MTHSSEAARPADELPRAMPALWRTFRLGYRAEPRLLVASMATTLLMMLPDAVLALWFKLLTDGVLDADRTMVLVAAAGLAASATATWYAGIVDTRVQRRFRDRIAIAMEAHIARLQASVPTVEHQERPDYLDRLAVLRDQSFTLDHLFSSLLTNIGLVVRLAVTALLLASIHPALALLLLAGVPAMTISIWRPAVERSVQESVAPHDRLARHLFSVGTTAAPAKEVRVLGIEDGLRARRQGAEHDGSSRWRRRVGDRRRGRRRRGRCSAWRTRLASRGLRRVSTATSAMSCSSSSPASGCRSTSPRRWVSSGSCAACGSTRRCA